MSRESSGNFVRKIGLLLCLPMLSIMLLIFTLAEPAVGQTDETKIAYVASSIDHSEIRMVNPDGSDDQLVWRSPVIRPAVDMIGWLDWKPNGSEIMFDSGHDWTRSMAIRDLYGVAPDGSQLRRLSAPPGPQGSANLPTGQVTFIADATESGDVQLYIEGMLEPIEYFARSGESYMITATVADWGEDVRQFIRIYDPDPLSPACNFSAEGWVDVIPGQLTDYGRINFPLFANSCPVLFSPTWFSDNQSIIYLRRDPSSAGGTDNNVWLTEDGIGASFIGTRLIDMSNYTFRDPLYRIVAAPAGEREGDFLILENQTNPFIVYGNVTNPNPESGFRPNQCDGVKCEILDIQWLPDSSGFLFSLYDEALGGGSFTGSIIQYKFDTAQYSTIYSVENVALGKFSISPDGSQIVTEISGQLADDVNAFTYGPRLLCPCAIWVINSDGSGEYQLAADGRAPAWSKVAPSVSQPSQTPVPGQTPQPTPVPTPINNPNVVPQLWFSMIRR